MAAWRFCDLRRPIVYQLTYLKACIMDFFMGQIILCAFNYVPPGFAACNGQLMSVTQYPGLFALLSNFYGGDGINNFALPNLSGVFPMGTGNTPSGNFLIGQTGGAYQYATQGGERIAAAGVPNGSNNILVGGPISSTPSMPPYVALNYFICLEGIFPPHQ